MTPEPACRPIVRAGSDLWHDVEHVGKGIYETKGARNARIREAKEVCATCPVKAACLAAATDGDHGIWGGLTRADGWAAYKRERRAKEKAA